MFVALTVPRALTIEMPKIRDSARIGGAFAEEGTIVVNPHKTPAAFCSLDKGMPPVGFAETDAHFVQLSHLCRQPRQQIHSTFSASIPPRTVPKLVLVGGYHGRQGGKRSTDEEAIPSQPHAVPFFDNSYNLCPFERFVRKVSFIGGM
ncbi:MAG: hypothetical protein COZ05_18940 [Armatimonadetes bacterium CG_4_10_14_3_um_filter_59_10]|nr:MAG: hypothetical protein COZ05_18940 [Armatimonadetes bacterium CG_4_10_14_3_um_filter_59_10]